LLLFAQVNVNILSGASAGNSKKRRVGFEDDKNGAARNEREFLERVRREVSRPQYRLFEDYNEMVAQFGYIALWSTIWPLAPCESSTSFFHVCPR
jgi:anoctamin-10